jgi:hypothetical protein
MANWHALTGSSDGNSFRIVFHIAIPSANNRAGINYQVAMINSGIGGKTALPDGDGNGGTISATEKAAIQAGSLFEYAEDFATNPGELAAALQARIDARYTALIGIVQADLSKRLTYFGYTH